MGSSSTFSTLRSPDNDRRELPLELSRLCALKGSSSIGKYLELEVGGWDLRDFRTFVSATGLVAFFIGEASPAPRACAAACAYIESHCCGVRIKSSSLDEAGWTDSARDVPLLELSCILADEVLPWGDGILSLGDCT